MKEDTRKNESGKERAKVFSRNTRKKSIPIDNFGRISSGQCLGLYLSVGVKGASQWYKRNLFNLETQDKVFGSYDRLVFDLIWFRNKALRRVA